jgi:hypothetical protein
MPCKVLPALLLVLPFCFCLLSFLFASGGGAALKETKLESKPAGKTNRRKERKKERKIHPLLSFLIALPTFCVFLSFHRVFVLSGRARERATLLCFVIFKRVRDGDTSN